MKKLLVFGFVLALVLGFSTDTYARDVARKDRAIAIGGTTAVGIVDGDRENAEVDQYGRLEVKDVAGHTVYSGWGDALVYTGKCVIHSIHVQSVTAASYAEVYDATTATGTPKFDPMMAVANENKHVSDIGAVFDNGIYVNTNGGVGITNSDVLVTIVYDPI